MRPQDGSESAPRGLQTAPRAFQTAPRPLQEALRQLREAQDSRRLSDAEKSAPGGFRDCCKASDHCSWCCRAASIMQQNLDDQTVQKAVRFHPSRVSKLRTNPLIGGLVSRSRHALRPESLFHSSSRELRFRSLEHSRVFWKLLMVPHFQGRQSEAWFKFIPRLNTSEERD